MDLEQSIRDDDLNAVQRLVEAGAVPDSFQVALATSLKRERIALYLAGRAGGPLGEALQAAAVHGSLEVGRACLDRGAGGRGRALELAVLHNRPQLAALIHQKGVTRAGLRGALAIAQLTVHRDAFAAKLEAWLARP